MSDNTYDAGQPRTKEGLPWQAFAIVGSKHNPDTWKLPHHTKAIFRAIKGRLDIDKTVDWNRMSAAVAALSPGGYRGQRVDAGPEDILSAAKHLAAHYLASDKPASGGKPLPDTLAAMV